MQSTLDAVPVESSTSTTTSTLTPPPTTDLPPEAQAQTQAIELLSQLWLGRAISVAARMRLADVLVAQPLTADELAVAVRAHAPALRRLCRALVAFKVFTQDEQGRLGLGMLGQALVSNRHGSLQGLMATLFGGEHYEAWGDLEYTVRTGETAFNHHFGTDCWTWYRQNPEAAAAFNQTMVDSTVLADRAIVEVCDFSPYRHVVDIGGGHGSLLRLALEQNPSARGTLFDQPAVIDEAKAAVAEAGLTGRCELVAGSFFERVPSGGDAYLLKYILHDWDDERCVSILRNIRKAIASDGTLMVFDCVIPPPGQADLSPLMDLNMMVMTGGRERTEPELRELLSRGGFALQKVLPTKATISVSLAEPV